MLSFLPAPISGCLSFLMYVVNTLLWTTPIFAIAFLKLLIPIQSWRILCNRSMNFLAVNWISCNSFNQWLTGKTRWHIQGVEGLSLNEKYLVLSNHQSWVDVLVLQRAFNYKIPFLMFFVKQELIWMPVLGLVWWAMDYPFVKRYSREFLEKNPHLRGKDIETTRKACEKYRFIPVSIANFVEGTRFTTKKHLKQKSPYKNLLKPKAGGISFALSAMGGQLHRILNVTIVYPEGMNSFWQFLCGKVSEIRVHIENLPISEEFLGNYEDPEFRESFQNWLNALWRNKDMRIESMRRESTVSNGILS
jgi:1-acyl-sn-glycerol-3-phosphate acyltransferase